MGDKNFAQFFGKEANGENSGSVKVEEQSNEEPKSEEEPTETAPLTTDKQITGISM